MPQADPSRSEPWPRYLLFADTLASETRAAETPAVGAAAGTQRLAGWRFMLHAVDSDHNIFAGDQEPDMTSERLALMAAIRGLEALDQPSRVKLVSTSAYVRRGLSRGLPEWRCNNWKWERFGRLEPIRDEGLWRRVDAALAHHRVSLRGWPPRGADARTVSNRLAPQRKRRTSELRLSATEQVVDRVISEPALLVVRGKRRRALAANQLAAADDRLAVAG
ncbi:MAG: RNase H family protein [Planctomycetota bacterium]